MRSTDLLRFHLTGERPAGSELMRGPFVPALMAPFLDTSTLRYDYPLIMIDDDSDVVVRPLTETINELIRQMAPPGPAGEQRRRVLLRLEGDMRRQAAANGGGTLSDLWAAAISRLPDEADAEFAARARPEIDGVVVDCDPQLAQVLVEHLWRVDFKERAKRFRDDVETLLTRLDAILYADHARSRAGVSPAGLQASVGSSFRREFDFDEWSRLVTPMTPAALHPDRRRRLELTVSILEGQEFFARPDEYRFDSCVEADVAFRRRIPHMVDLVKALTIARLEVENQYRDQHNDYFRTFDEKSLTRDDLDVFPTYLVCCNAADMDEREVGKAVELISSDKPFKIMIQTQEILAEPSIGGVRWPGEGTRLANLALGLPETFVLQATNSHLPRMEPGIRRGLLFRGPVVFNIFCGLASTSGISTYLIGAAATRSRAFPTFIYDPAAGDDWASCFQLDFNPQNWLDWPTKELSYEDADLGLAKEELDFTFVDFAACDPRYAEHFWPVPTAKWSDEMERVTRFLNGDPPSNQVPYIWAASGDGALARLVIDRQLIQAARSCRRNWRSLQELAGIHNSHATRILEAERTRWENERASELMQSFEQATPRPEEETIREADASGTTDAPGDDAPEAVNPDVAYIETARCTTCDECTSINPRMFAYDENKQAYIADLTAGTYREMVEAAEVCQVAIIHPGKPWNPNELGLELLVERAAAFNQAGASRGQS